MRWTAHQRGLLKAMGLDAWVAAAQPCAETSLAAVGASAPEQAAPPDPGLPPPTIRLKPASEPALQPGERAQGIAAMGWPALQQAVAACTACGLCRSRTQTVFGSGNRRARWMIVGEAPGEQEDLRGEPFVGKSGQLLDSMLRALGLTREVDSPQRQVYIANTLKCRPPANRNPEPSELAQCEPFLARQIELVRPDVILAMGRFAVQALLRSDQAVGQLRGRVHRYHDVALVVSYHPAYLLRNPQDKARAWDDLCLALDVARRSQPQPE